MKNEPRDDEYGRYDWEKNDPAEGGAGRVPAAVDDIDKVGRGAARFRPEAEVMSDRSADLLGMGAAAARRGSTVVLLHRAVDARAWRAAVGGRKPDMVGVEICATTRTKVNRPDKDKGH